MKKLFTILLVLISLTSQSQVLQEPTIYGILYNINGAKTATLVPTVNGVPVLPTPLKKYNQGAIWIDSTNKKLYFYNPSDSSYNEAGLSQSTVDSILGGYYTRGQVDSIIAVTKSLFNGGTTGQTLVKNSNTDLDFSWSTPAGSTNSNTGSGYRLAVPFTNNIRTIFSVSPILLDSVTNTNALTFTFDTTLYHSTAYSNTVYGSLSQQNTNTSNIASNTTAITGKQNSLTLTTTGTSGAATLTGSTLNIPQYTGGGITADSIITATAGQTSFIFSSVPASINDYIIFINGNATTNFTTSGNTITLGMTDLLAGDKVRYKRIK
jgi:hypothetical protein